MNKTTRIEKIAQNVEIYKNNPYGKQDIPWEDKLIPMSVYQIPLEDLIYNKYNGRILSRTKSLESQGQEIDAESEKGRDLIEKLLWESNPSRNKQTQDSIKKMGQERIGIITKDGIIIDGNRRAMLLRSVGKDYFKTVVLPVTLEENPIEIEKLETTYQMGEDEKLGYNATEKYLKAKGLRSRNVSIEKIALWMGESVGTIQDYLDVMETMDDYLDYLGYTGLYTQLDDREDHFINLTKWIKNFTGEQSGKAFDGYRDNDVDDLKMICYDYIRIKYEGKDFRIIAFGQRESHFFGNKAIWEDFRNFHFRHVEPIKDREEKVCLESENIEAYLNDRDKRFDESTKDGDGNSFMDENIILHRQQLRNKQISDQPVKLVRDAINSLDAIDQRHRAFSQPEVLKMVETINERTTQMLRDRSPERLLSQVIRILESIKLDTVQIVADHLLDKVKSIEKIAYQLEKGIKGL